MIPSLHTGTAGFSKSEQYLGRIAQQTFLSLWSHPNLFHSRNRELADLLVIFGDDVIVFSDKSCECRDGEHGWSRWYRRAVLESAYQLRRAAKWLRKSPSKIYMDAKCERGFPLHIPASPRIHLVAVSTGARDAAARHPGSYGNIAIATDANGKEPFALGDLDRSKDFIHIFDDESLTVVLRERDTIADFLEYLRKRAAFLRSGPVIQARSELDLLAHYLKGMSGSEHEFVSLSARPGATHVFVDGDWDGFIASGPYERKKLADAESYVWDRLIEDVAGHADRGTLVVGQERGLPGNEEALRYLAAEDRFSRRLLANALLGVRELGARDVENVRVRTMRSPRFGHRAYVFIVARRQPPSHEDAYRQFRQKLLKAHAEITKLRYEDIAVVIGIGVCPANDRDGSVDLAIRTYTSWSDADRSAAERLREQLGWVRDPSSLEKHSHHYEFPELVMSGDSGRLMKSSKTERNAKHKRKAQRAARRKNHR